MFNYLEIIKLSFIVYLASIFSHDKIKLLSIGPVVLTFLLIFLLESKSGLGIIVLFILVGLLIALSRFNGRVGVVYFIGIQVIYLATMIVPLFEEARRLGGFYLGSGLGEGLSKLYFSQSVFSTITEELGFVGALSIIFLYLLFSAQGVMIAIKANDLFDRLLVFGSFGMISFQALQYIWMTLGIIPASGVSLPFMHYGSSLVLVNASLVGIITNVSLKSRR